MDQIEQKVENSIDGGPLDQFAGYLIRRASTAFGNDFAQAMEGTGLRQVLFGVLVVVNAHPGISQSEAGQMLGIQRANMVSLINELMDRGLIDRKVVEGDRRAFSLRTTALGERCLRDALHRVALHEERMLAPLSADERKTFLRLLQRVADI